MQPVRVKVRCILPVERIVIVSAVVMQGRQFVDQVNINRVTWICHDGWPRRKPIVGWSTLHLSHPQRQARPAYGFAFRNCCRPVSSAYQ